MSENEDRKDFEAEEKTIDALMCRYNQYVERARLDGYDARTEDAPNAMASRRVRLSWGEEERYIPGLSVDIIHRRRSAG